MRRCTGTGTRELDKANQRRRFCIQICGETEYVEEADNVVEYAHKPGGSDIRDHRFLFPGMGALVEMGGKGLDGRSDQVDR